MKHYQDMEKNLNSLAETLKTSPADISKKIASLLDELKTLKAENASLKNKLAADSMGDIESGIKEINGVKYIGLKLNDVEMNELRNLGDQLKEKTEGGVVVLASNADGKVNLLVACGDAAMNKGAHAGNIIKAVAGLVGGGGGGRPNMAQAGGKNPEGIDKALEAAFEEAGKQIK